MVATVSRRGPVRTMRRRSADQLAWLVLAATAAALCYTGVSLAAGGLADAGPGHRVGPVRRLLKEFTPLEKARGVPRPCPRHELQAWALTN